MCVYEVLAGTVCEYPGKCMHTQTHMPKMKAVQKIGHMFGTKSHLSYMTGSAEIYHASKNYTKLYFR